MDEEYATEVKRARTNSYNDETYSDIHKNDSSVNSEAGDTTKSDGNSTSNLNNNSSVASNQIRSTKDDASCVSNGSSHNDEMSSGHFEPLQESRRAMNRRYQIITVSELMGQNVKCRKTVLYLILLRIVSTSTNNQSKMYAVKNLKKKNFIQQNTSAYSRLFLCLDPNSSSGKTVYLVQGRGIGTNLWAKNASVRDDGTLTIGSVVAVHNPKPITKLLANDVPILEYNLSLILMKQRVMKAIPIDTNVPENSAQGFIENGCKVEVKSVEVLESVCNGHFCDRQRCVELQKIDKPCGCYFMRGLDSKLSIVHDIEVTCQSSGEKFSMEQFSSLQFSTLYLTQYFPQDTKRIEFDNTEYLDELYDSIDNVTEYINNNGGFTVIGWYKRGEINDQSNLEAVEKISSSTVVHHFVSLLPTSFDRLKMDELQEMKYDVTNVL